MTADDFAVTIERREGEMAVVLAGELYLYRAPEIERALVDATEPGPDSKRRSEALPQSDGGNRAAEGVPRILVVDLQAVTFLDSTMLGLLIAADRRQRGHSGELLILVGPQTPMSAFEVTGLDHLLSIRGADGARDGDSGPALSPPAQAAARDTRAISAALVPPTSPGAST